MALGSPIKWLPSATLVVALALGAYYRFAYHPLVRSVIAQDKELTVLWDRLVSSNRQVRACQGLTVDNHLQRVADLEASLSSLEAAHKLVQRRIEIDATTRGKMALAWQLIDFQIERLQQAGLLLRLAKEHGVALEPAALAGLPEHSVDLPEPRLLWPRLEMATQLLLVAIQSKVASVRSLTQLPANTYPGPGPNSPPVEEIVMRIELVGPTDSATRFLKNLPLQGEQLRAVGLSGPVTNKPAFFLDRVLVRKHAPDRPGEVHLEARVCSFVPWPALVAATVGQ